MKKLILSLLTMASLAFAANAATTCMIVKTDDGKVVNYDVESVVEVYYQETSSDQGVTVSGKMGKYTYVDLGLPSGTKWATYNVGATKPTEYGDYFAWGETEPKKEYKFAHKWCEYLGTDSWHNTIYRYTKYWTNGELGTVDNKTVLDVEDDAATANWGKEWRMPTSDEIKELLEGCFWKQVNDFHGSGVNGFWGISKANRATIFLPAAGYFNVTVNDAVGSVGYYWSSSLDESYSGDAYTIEFYDIISRGDAPRYTGRSVRAVLR